MDLLDWAKEQFSKWQRRQIAEAEYWNVFTPRAQRAFVLANEEAKKMNQNFIGTEHLLLGLIGLGNGVAVNVLKNLGLNLENVRAEVKRQADVNSEQTVLDYIPVTTRVMEVLEVAKKEAKALGHTYVGTEHLLLGLLSEKDGVAWRIFKMANIDPEKMRQEILTEITPIFLPGNNEKKGQG